MNYIVITAPLYKPRKELLFHYYP